VSERSSFFQESITYPAQSHLPSAQQSHEQPQSPVQTPVTQQPQSQVAQQHGSQLTGQVPPQQAELAAGAGAKSDNTSRVKYNMDVLLRNQRNESCQHSDGQARENGRAAGHD
jgi:hypothetical protein